MKRSSFFILACSFAASAFAGETSDKKAIVPAPEESWQFKLSMPGWIAGLHGDTGINGMISHIDADPGQVIRRVDMTASFRGEVSKGRFGLMADFLYLSLSDGIGTNGPVKKLDAQLDQTMGDLAVRWRLIDEPRGSLDFIAGVRYTNMFQQAVVQSNDERIGDASESIVKDVSAALRTTLSDSRLASIIAQNLTSRIGSQVGKPGGETPVPLPIGPLDGKLAQKIASIVQPIIDARKAELAAALKAQAAAVGAAAKAAAQQKVEKLQSNLSRKIADAVSSKLNTRAARTDDWWDPYVGLRGRYNFNERFYFTAKADIGGFGVGSDLTWQASAAFGMQLNKNMFAEVGYRALGVDYDKGGLILDTVTRGVEINLGLAF